MQAVWEAILVAMAAAAALAEWDEVALRAAVVVAMDTVAV